MSLPVFADCIAVISRDPTTFQNGSDAEDYTGISSDMDDEVRPWLSGSKA